MKKSILYTLLMLLLLSSCSVFQNTTLKGRQGKISQEGTISCFPIGTLDDKGKLLHCETSAAVYYGDKILIASDKVTSPSSIFEVPYTTDEGLNATAVNFVENAVLNSVMKIEDFTIAPDGKLVVGTTAFDRQKAEKPEWDAFNSIVYWETGKDTKVKLAHPTKTKDGKSVVMSSVTLRQYLEAAFKADNLPIPNYYKIEGLAIIPGNKILFGIREMGNSYEDFTYQIKIISADYIYAKSELEMSNFRIVYDFDASKTVGIKHSVALSSIEYDQFNNRLYLLTSYEMPAQTPESIGAYLWILPIDDFYQQNPPQLVMKSKNKPLLFAHKSEAVTVIDKNTVFIINDDDRVTGDKKVTDKENDFSREPQQAAYYIVRIR